MLKITAIGIANPAKSLPWAIRSNVFLAVQKGMKYAEKISKEKYLSGEGRATRTLNRRSGALKRSVVGEGHRGPAGYVATGTLSSDSEYAGIHEYGGIINHPGAIARFFHIKFFSQKFNRWIRTPTTEPHDIPIPARPFLSTAMRKADPYIQSLIDKAMSKAFNSKGKS